jgi:hypothetical protein
VGADATFNNTTVQGLFKTASSGARIEISENGITSYNSSEQLSGLVIQKTTENQFSDLKLYWNGSEYFTVYNNADNSLDLEIYSHGFLSTRYTVSTNTVSTTARGIWNYNGSEIANQSSVSSIASSVASSIVSSAIASHIAAYHSGV